MSETLQWIIVGIIISVALILLIKSLFRKTTDNKGCGCGCSGCKMKKNCNIKSTEYPDSDTHN